MCVDLLVSKAGSCCILMHGFRIVSHSLGTIHCFQGARCGGVFVTGFLFVAVDLLWNSSRLTAWQQ